MSLYDQKRILFLNWNFWNLSIIGISQFFASSNFIALLSRMYNKIKWNTQKFSNIRPDDTIVKNEDKYILYM